MSAALPLVAMPTAPTEAWRSGFAPLPEVELPRFTGFELWDILRGGEAEADDLERGLAKAARIHGAIELAIAEGLAAPREGDRLAELCYHLDDYAREVLDMKERTGPFNRGWRPPPARRRRGPAAMHPASGYLAARHPPETPWTTCQR